jgi:hypothetical protein
MCGAFSFFNALAHARQAAPGQTDLLGWARPKLGAESVSPAAVLDAAKRAAMPGPWADINKDSWYALNKNGTDPTKEIQKLFADAEATRRRWGATLRVRCPKQHYVFVTDYDGAAKKIKARDQQMDREIEFSLEKDAQGQSGSVTYSVDAFIVTYSKR